MFEDEVQQVKDKVLEVNDRIDAKVDGKIDELQSSRFSWLKFSGVALALLVILGFLAVN